jgi:hypothetical protein
MTEWNLILSFGLFGLSIMALLTIYRASSQAE